MAATGYRWIQVGDSPTSGWALEGNDDVTAVQEPRSDWAANTWVSATALNQAQTWTFTDDASIPADAVITAVSVGIGCGSPAGTNLVVKATVDGVSQSTLSTILVPTVPPTSSSVNTLTYLTNPGTGLAWTRAQIFASTFGVKVTSLSDYFVGNDSNPLGEFRVFYHYAYVVYTSASTTLTPSTVINPGFDTVTVSGGCAFTQLNRPVGDPTTNSTTGTYVVVDPYGTNETVEATVLNSTSLSFVAPDHVNELVDVNVITYRTGERYASFVLYSGASGLTFGAPTAGWWLLANPTEDAVGATNQYADVDGGSPKVTLNWYYYGYQPDGRWVTSSAPASDLGWWFSTESYGGASTVVLGGQPGNPRSFTEVPSAFSTVFGGSPGIAVTYNNRLIYAKGGYTVGTDYPTLRTFDGQSDRVSATIPPTAAGTIPKTVMSMLAANGTIYVSTLDTGASSADWTGRVFSFDPISGQLAQIGAGFTGGNVPYALAWHSNRLWVGSNKGDGSAGTIYFIRPGIDSAWTADYTLATSTVGGATSMLSYKGALLIGTDNAAAAFARVLKRSPAGAYTTTDTGTGGTARVNNGFYSMCEFGGNLYTGYFNNDSGVVRIAKIRKYDGTSWTTAYTGATTTLVPYIGLFSEGTNLYAIGGGLALAVALLRTPDGTTWTDVSTYLSGSSTGIPAFGTLVL